MWKDQKKSQLSIYWDMALNTTMCCCNCENILSTLFLLLSSPLNRTRANANLSIQRRSVLTQLDLTARLNLLRMTPTPDYLKLSYGSQTQTVSAFVWPTQSAIGHFVWARAHTVHTVPRVRRAVFNHAGLCFLIFFHFLPSFLLPLAFYPPSPILQRQR